MINYNTLSTVSPSSTQKINLFDFFLSVLKKPIIMHSPLEHILIQRCTILFDKRIKYVQLGFDSIMLTADKAVGLINQVFVLIL